MVGARGWGGGARDLVLNGHSFHLGGWKGFWRGQVWVVFSTTEGYVHFKWLRWKLLYYVYFTTVKKSWGGIKLRDTRVL